MDTSSYTQKPQRYFSYTRHDIISLIPPDPEQKVLEIGASGGNTILYLKENKLAKEVMGVELMQMDGSNQKNALLDKFQIADIEKEEIDAPPEYFDIIICADVLEHLVDPWKTIEKISVHLKKDGLLIASLPNIREWKTLFKIIFKKDFRYDPYGGVLDKTHLRFFCKKNILQLLTTTSLSPIYCKANYLLKVVLEGRKRRIINRLTFGIFSDFLTVQYLVVAKKK